MAEPDQGTRARETEQRRSEPWRRVVRLREGDNLPAGWRVDKLLSAQPLVPILPTTDARPEYLVEIVSDA